MSEKKAEKFPTYKGKPLVRCGDTIYYGSMKDKYVIKMDIKSKKKVKDLEVADRVAVHLMYTDAAVRNRKQIVRSSEQKGLYLALDIASAWLSRALAEDNDHRPAKNHGASGRCLERHFYWGVESVSAEKGM